MSQVRVPGSERLQGTRRDDHAVQGDERHRDWPCPQSNNLEAPRRGQRELMPQPRINEALDSSSIDERADNRVPSPTRTATTGCVQGRKAAPLRNTDHDLGTRCTRRPVRHHG